MNTENSKPIGYECQKAILHGLTYETRGYLSQACPAIRAAQRVVPYRFDYECIYQNWTRFESLSIGKVESQRPRSEEYVRKLLNKCFKTGTVIQELRIKQDRSVLPTHSGVRVNELSIGYCPFDLNFEKINSFIDKRYPLKRVSVEIAENSVDFLNIPLFRNAGSLTVSVKNSVVDPIAFYEKIMSFGNQNISIHCANFSVDSIYQLAMKWIDTKQPIGTKIRFTFYNYWFYLDVFYYFTRKLPRSSFKIIPRDSLLITISEDMVLMLFVVEDSSAGAMKSQMEIKKKDDVVSF